MLINEAQRYEGTSFCLLKDRSQLATHITAMVSMICKAIRRMSGHQRGAMSTFCLSFSNCRRSAFPL